jgi:hypothetical protein
VRLWTLLYSVIIGLTGKGLVNRDVGRCHSGLLYVREDQPLWKRPREEEKWLIISLNFVLFVFVTISLDVSFTSLI